MGRLRIHPRAIGADSEEQIRIQSPLGCHQVLVEVMVDFDACSYLLIERNVDVPLSYRAEQSY